MSKVLYVCSRRHVLRNSTENKLLAICNELVPDNVKNCPEHKVCVKQQLAYAVSMSNGALHESNMSLLLGFLYEKREKDWVTPRSDYPDGNYVLIRNEADEIEVVSDGSGSRTIWYYHDDELFLASTSQRAIILYLGSFLFDDRVIPWVLSTGSLGPELSWDRRLQRLQPDSSVRLNKKTWTLAVNQNPITFLEMERQKTQHKELLADTIKNTIKSLEALDFKHWALPLSGGYDSRAILCYINEEFGIPKDLKAVTWGLKESVNEERNDANVARDLANTLGVQHDYCHTDLSSEPIETIIDRYIFCSEGRIDHLAGYMDGMEIWKQFHDSRITGVIRGDEGFGWKMVSSDLTVKLSVSCALCADYENLKNIIEDFNLPTQQLPLELMRKEGESLSGWRDRLYHAYRIPTVLSALSDIKFSYIEVINPLLSKAILTVVRSIPDNLRTEKNLFKEIVNSIGPKIPFGNKDATANSKDILESKPIVDLLRCEIGSSYATGLFGEGFVNYILEGIRENQPKSKSGKRQLRERVLSILPRFIKNFLRDNALNPKVNGNVLAFRVFLILKMHKNLEADATKSGS